MKEFILKYKYNIILYCLMILSLYINFVFFYTKIGFSFCSGVPPTRWLYTLVNCITLLSPLLFLNKRYIWIALLYYIILIFTFFIPHTIYYRFYANIIPISSFFELGNLIELSGVLHSYFKLSDFFYLLNTVCLFGICFFVLKKNIVDMKIRYKIILFGISIFLFIGLFSASSVVAMKRNGKNFWWRYEAGIFDQPLFTSYYGIIPHWIYQIYHFAKIDNVPITVEENRRIDDYLVLCSEIQCSSTEQTTKNLIIIVVESFSSWLSNFENGESISFLTSIQQSDSTIIYIPRVLSQVSHGRSSDAQLMYNTGLLPIFNGAASSLYDNQYYPALAEVLSSSATIMGDSPSMWNQQKMNIAYHIDTLISSENLVHDEIIGIGISDKSTFRQAITVLKDIQQPFYAQIITLSSHNEIVFADYPTDLQFPKHYSDDVKNYIKSIEYVDQAIAQFVNDLKQNGLYDNSVIVIVGDHEGMKAQEIYKYDPALVDSLEIATNNTFIPLYILNSGQTYQQIENQVIGQIDIYPTLLDIMGISDYYWQGLGTSIFSEKPPTFAVDKNMNVIGDVTGYTQDEIQHKIDAWAISDLMIRKKYLEVLKNKSNE